MSRKNGGAKYVKNFNGFTHLLTMLYAVIMRFDSLREIEAAMTAEVRKEREARLAAEKQDRYHNILNLVSSQKDVLPSEYSHLQPELISTTKRLHPSTMVSWLLPVKWN